MPIDIGKKKAHSKVSLAQYFGSRICKNPFKLNIHIHTMLGIRMIVWLTHRINLEWKYSLDSVLVFEIQFTLRKKEIKRVYIFSAS